jgi:hypothetical protein
VASFTRMKLVYVAGPYIGDGTFDVIEWNIRHAERYAVALANDGIGLVCPHKLTEHFGIKATAGESFYLQLDMTLLDLCQAALFVPGWETSSGARHEHDFARAKGLPTFYPASPQDIGDIIAWYAEG